MLVGLISDTHGLVRPSVPAALAGVDILLHAGDVGGHQVLEALERIAPVRAVRGNTDDPDDPSLDSKLDLELDGIAVHVSHGHELGTPTPGRLLALYAASVIVYGHTHRPGIHRAQGRLVVNPGAAGPRRFDIRPSVALLTIERGEVDVRIVGLDA